MRGETDEIENDSNPIFFSSSFFELVLWSIVTAVAEFFYNKKTVAERGKTAR